MILNNKNMKEFNIKKKIETSVDFEDYCIDLFERFLDTFLKENYLVREAEEGDLADPDEITFMYTRKGDRLASKMLRLLYKIGEAHYPNEDINIITYKYQQL